MVKKFQVLYAMGYSPPYPEVKGMPMEEVIHSGVCTIYILIFLVAFHSCISL